VSVQEITTDEFRRMSDQEGLVIQDCGGDLQEWVDGINEMLVVDNQLTGYIRSTIISCIKGIPLA
jgi:hypothetical protein